MLEEREIGLTRDTARLAADRNRATHAPGLSSVWDRLAELAEAVKAPADAAERAMAILAIERAGWNLMAAQTLNGALTYTEAHAGFDHLVRLLDSTSWADLPAAFRRAGLARVEPALAVRIREYVDTHMARRITLNGVARALGVSVSRITREFRARYGLTVRGYVTRRRVVRAVQLLVDTDMKVGAIASVVGFESETTLYRHVWRLLNTTPGFIRERRDRGAADRLLPSASDDTKLRT